MDINKVLDKIRRKYNCDAKWEENKHPRDEGGKFTSGSGSASETKTETSKPEKLRLTKDFVHDLPEKIYKFAQETDPYDFEETFEEFKKNLDNMNPDDLEKQTQDLLIENWDNDEYVKLGLDVIKGLKNPVKERPGDRDQYGRRTPQALLRLSDDGDYWIEDRAKKLQDDVNNAAGDKEKLESLKNEAENLYGFIRKRFDDPKSHMERNIYALNYAKQALKDIKNGLGE